MAAGQTTVVGGVFGAATPNKVAPILAGSDGVNVAPGVTLFDVTGIPLGTTGNPLNTTGGGGGGSSSVTLLAGSAAIGTVGVTALPALPAGTNAIGSVSVSNLPATQPVSQVATALTNSAAGTMGTTATPVVPFSATRKWLMISNRTTGLETQDIGSSNVTVLGGIPLAPGGGFLFNGPGAAGPIYGITTVAGSPFSYVEG